MKSNTHLSIASALVSMLSVQGGASIAKHLFSVLGPAGATTLRIGLAGMILILIHRPKITHFSREEYLFAIFYGLSIGTMNLCFYYGIQRVPLGLGVTLEFIGPLSLALITSKKLTDFLWAGLAAMGIVLIVPWVRDGVDPRGLLFVFLAGILWAVYIVAGGKITRRMKSSDAVSSGMCIATLFVLPFGLFSGDLSRLNAKLLLLGLGVAIFSSALPFSLDLFALKKLPSKTFSILQSLQPAFGALSGLFFLGEMLSIRQWIAIVCVISASLGTSLCSSISSGKVTG